MNVELTAWDVERLQTALQDHWAGFKDAEVVPDFEVARDLGALYAKLEGAKDRGE